MHLQEFGSSGVTEWILRLQLGGRYEEALLLRYVVRLDVRRSPPPPVTPATPELLLHMRVVTFDAAGTLIRLVRPPGVIYAEVARLFGFSLDPDRVQEAFRSTWRHFCATH